MKPIEFSQPEANDFYNTPYGELREALERPIKIHSSLNTWEVLSYYYADGHMHLDIQKRK